MTSETDESVQLQIMMLNYCDGIVKCSFLYPEEDPSVRLHSNAPCSDVTLVVVLYLHYAEGAVLLLMGMLHH